MLTIKKRFPSQKLYLYGGTAFVAGFAGIMLILVQTNTHVRDFMVGSPISFETTSNPALESTDTTAPSEETILSQDEVFVAPTQPAGRSTSSPSQTPEQPTPATPTEEPAPSEPTTPTEPTPTDPEPEPTPEEPTNPIEEIVEVILP